ncbi:MAG: hypothetical protein J7K95_05965 [Thermoplasmata archaeon]|nr:hypothetical protein [Thermoplasmata archaeon]
MIFEIENMAFELPASTLLTGSMAAAKPIFAQKFIVKWVENGGKVAYFATSSPIDGVISNLKVLGLDGKMMDKITFFDYNPQMKEIKEIEEGYAGNFSDERQLKEALNMVNDSLVVIPSFTLLLVGIEDKFSLVDILVKNLIEKDITSFIAVNSAMFKEINKMLEQHVDNVLEFIKKEERIYIKVKKFRGEVAFKEWLFKFPIHLFHKTKKEVAERTSKLIKEKRKRSINIYIEFGITELAISWKRK